MTEATKNYVVLSWKPPAGKGLEGVMYYVEKVRVISSLIFSKIKPLYIPDRQVCICSSVCVRHRQLAEGEHGDPC